MEAPKCRICGKAGWGHVCGGSAPQAERPCRATRAAAESTPRGPPSSVPTDSRKEYLRDYMREYMRKRRNGATKA